MDPASADSLPLAEGLQPPAKSVRFSESPAPEGPTPQEYGPGTDEDDEEEEYEHTETDENAPPDDQQRQPVHNSGRRSTYTTIKHSPFVSPSACTHLVKLPNIIVMVGLPARGKTYISKKLCRYLNWIGIRTRVFNLGDYRRLLCKTYEGNEFFNPNNAEGAALREQCAQMALEEVFSVLGKGEAEVAIFDGTNTTRERRGLVCEQITSRMLVRVFFLESVCDDPKIIEANIQDVKVNSPDYRNMDKERAREDFIKRIEQYRALYEPLDEALDNDYSFIKVVNAGRSFFVHNILGHVQSRVVYFLMNIHLLPRSIFLTRHGESEFNRMGRIGGDSPLSERGLSYARKLAEYFETARVPDLRVWSSQKIRAVQTANHLKHVASYIEHWKALDELDAGICEGLTYEEIGERYPEQLKARDLDKYHYRYPSGESYEDLVGRLEPVIMELERQENILVISHQAIIRGLLAYFLDKPREEMPYLRVPLHSLIKLTPMAYGCKMEVIKFDVEAVDTHREKPPWVVKKLAKPTLGKCKSPP